MTASGYPCGHELINNCETVEEYADKIKYLSDSTTALPFIKSPYPDRKTLVIHRDDSPIREHAFRLDTISGLHVDFIDIGSRIGEIFEYLTGSKINIFRQLNITTMEEMNDEATIRLLSSANKQD